MGFFSNIADQFKAAGSILKTNISAAADYLNKSSKSSQTASVADSFGLDKLSTNMSPVGGQSKEGITPTQVNLGLVPTGSKGSTASSVNYGSTNRQLSPNAKSSSASSIEQSLAGIPQSGKRSVATPKPKSVSGSSGVGGQSSQSFGMVRTQYGGESTTPMVSVAGAQGVPGQNDEERFRSVSSFGSANQSMGGFSGAPGISGGGSNYTGNLGASGGASTSLTLGQSEEDKRREQAQTQVINQATGQPANVMAPSVLQTTPTYNSLASKPTTTNFNTAPPTGPINLDTLSQGLSSISSAISSKGTFNAADIQGFYDQVQSYQDQLTQYNLQQEGIMAEPFVAETFEQTQWLDSQPTDFRAQFDQVYKDSGVADINANITAKQAQINATNTAFQQIIKDIQDNPELPKGLAAKRISDFVDRNAIQLQNMNAELANLISSRDYANDQVNQYYGIIKDQAAEDARKREANQSLLNNFISSGAIANFSDKALQQASIATGISVSALKAAKKSVVDKQKDYSNFYTQTNDAGDLTIIGVDNKGNAKVLSTVKGVGTKTKTTDKSSYNQGVLGQLPTSVQTKIIGIADAFGSTDVVKKFNATVDSINVVNNIGADSKNPADHQQVVYAFAKALDPDSVVREGEYATIKKYAQSAVDKFGKEISNAISGTGFLSANAISNIKSTMNQLYSSRLPQYENLFAEKSRVIDNIAGAPVANEIMVNYAGGAQQQSGGTLQSGYQGQTSSGMSYTIE